MKQVMRNFSKTLKPELQVEKVRTKISNINWQYFSSQRSKLFFKTNKKTSSNFLKIEVYPKYIVDYDFFGKKMFVFQFYLIQCRSWVILGVVAASSSGFYLRRRQRRRRGAPCHHALQVDQAHNNLSSPASTAAAVPSSSSTLASSRVKKVLFFTKKLRKSSYIVDEFFSVKIHKFQISSTSTTVSTKLTTLVKKIILVSLLTTIKYYYYLMLYFTQQPLSSTHSQKLVPLPW